MNRCLSIVMLPLVSCGLTRRDVSVAECDCTITVPASADIASMPDGTGYTATTMAWGVSIEVIPNDVHLPMPLDEFVERVQDTMGGTPLHPVEDLQVAGYPAVRGAHTVYTDGLEIQFESLAVHSGCSLVLVHTWVSPTQAWWYASRMQAAVDSLTFAPEAAIPCPHLGVPTLEMASDSLMASRAEVVPARHVLEHGNVAVTPPADSGWERVHYDSDVGPLLAYRTVDPGSVQRRPAVVWIEGGFGGPSATVWTEGPPENDQSAVDFQRAGIAVVAPSFRGEVDNPGEHEMFWGETADLLAAIEYTRSLPWVDPERVYLMGHSTGATHALLAGVAGAKVRAIVAIAGRADLSAVAADGGYGVEPFALDDAEQLRLRSAYPWVSYLESPTLYVAGEDDYYADAAGMADRSDGRMTMTVVEGGDHFNVLDPTRAVLIPQILQDDGPASTLALTAESIRSAMGPTPAGL